MNKISVCALYKFTRVENVKAIQQPLLNTLNENEIKGSLLIANEGINGTIAGSKQGILNVLDYLETQLGFGKISHKYSYSNHNPFQRTKVKLKKEIVTMGVEGIDPNLVVGTYVKPSEWNELISDPEVLLIDTRNDYEVEIGTFKNAVNPNTESFREFPDYVAKNLDKNKHKKVAMFCTGGIRCEKSTAYLKEQGFDDVYHLEGGILQYLEDVAKEDTMWQGDCFVFDGRVAVDHQLNKSKYDQCFACRLPITEQDKQSEHYIEGVSCHHCHDKYDDEQRDRFKERQRQITLAKARGEEHIGSNINQLIETKREKKLAVKKQQQQN